MCVNVPSTPGPPLRGSAVPSLLLLTAEQLPFLNLYSWCCQENFGQRSCHRREQVTLEIPGKGTKGRNRGCPKGGDYKYLGLTDVEKITFNHLAMQEKLDREN